VVWVCECLCVCASNRNDVISYIQFAFGVVSFCPSFVE
jgi:hypothetical protein